MLPLYTLNASYGIKISFFLKKRGVWMMLKLSNAPITNKKCCQNGRRRFQINIRKLGKIKAKSGPWCYSLPQIYCAEPIVWQTRVKFIVAYGYLNSTKGMVLHRVPSPWSTDGPGTRIWIKNESRFAHRGFYWKGSIWKSLVLRGLMSQK